MAQKQNGYPEDVWKAIRLLWESTPKISWRIVRETVSDALQTQVPGDQTCADRCKKEGWKKAGRRAGKIAKEGAGKGLENSTNSSPKENEEKSTELVVSAQNPSSIPARQDYVIEGLDLSKIIGLAQGSINTQAEIIRTYRERLEDLGVMYDNMIGSVPRNPDVETLEELNLHVDLIKKSMDFLHKLGATQFPVWGITPDMFEDSKSKGRTLEIKAFEEELETKREAVKSQQEAMFERQRRFLENSMAGYGSNETIIDIEEESEQEAE